MAVKTQTRIAVKTTQNGCKSSNKNGCKNPNKIGCKNPDKNDCKKTPDQNGSTTDLCCAGVLLICDWSVDNASGAGGWCVRPLWTILGRSRSTLSTTVILAMFVKKRSTSSRQTWPTENQRQPNDQSDKPLQLWNISTNKQQFQKLDSRAVILTRQCTFHRQTGYRDPLHTYSVKLNIIILRQTTQRPKQPCRRTSMYQILVPQALSQTTVVGFLLKEPGKLPLSTVCDIIRNMILCGDCMPEK